MPWGLLSWLGDMASCRCLTGTLSRAQVVVGCFWRAQLEGNSAEGLATGLHVSRPLPSPRVERHPPPQPPPKAALQSQKTAGLRKMKSF